MIQASDLILQSQDTECLWEVCRRRAREQPDDIAFTYLDPEEGEEQDLTYADLDDRALRIAASLQRRGLIDQPVLLSFPTGLEYISALLGCMYAGAIAVPAYPIEPMRAKRTLARLEVMLASCRPKAVLAAPDGLSLLSGMVGRALDGVEPLALPDLLDGPDDRWTPGSSDVSRIALLQYTSGSTLDPRGVMVTHANILFQVTRIGDWDLPDACGASWLPLFHDLGLFGGVFAPLYAGRRAVLMPPTSFVMRPLSWLEAITRFRATTSGAPTFGYDLCANKARPEDLEGLDLSSWRIALVGAEAVRWESLERFARVFEPCGFRMEAFLPAYGLAEAGLGVTAGPIDQAPIVRSFSIAKLEENVAESVEPKDPAIPSREFVGCGKPLESLDVRIVDLSTSAPAPEGRIGEIWVRGPGVARGYWNDAERTRLVFRNALGRHHDFMRTGDLGFFHDGEIFIAGRRKELIIIGGRNFYPTDIEKTASECDKRLVGQAAAAFSVERGGRERLVLVQEVRRAEKVDADKLISLLRRRIQEEHEAPVDGVVLLRPGSIPRTTSGKVQRSACREALIEDRLAAAASWFSPGYLGEDKPRRVDSSPKNADEILVWLTEQVARQIGVPLETINPDDPLGVYVLDSVTIVAMGLQLQDWLGREISPLDLMQATSLAELAGSLADVSASPPREAATHANGEANEAPATPIEAAVDQPTAALVNGSHSPAKSPATPPADPRLAALSAEEKRELLKKLIGQKANRLAVNPTAVPRTSAAEDSLSRGQTALWFLHQASPTSPAYNFLYVAKMAGHIDVESLRRAFSRLCERHPSLRAVFPLEEGRPVQRVKPDGGFAFAFRKAPGLDEDELVAMARADADRPFDLAAGPLLRATVIERGDKDFVLYVVTHHIVADLWSMDAMLRELRVLYRAERGAALRLAPLPASYLDYVRWQNDLVASAKGERLWKRWKERIEGADQLLDLPTSKPRGGATERRGATKAWILDADLSAQVNNLARAESSTLFVTLLSAFEVLLARYSGQKDFLVGSVSLGRARAEFEPVIGYFLNQLPLRARLEGDPTFRELLARSRQETLAALEDEEFPFVELVERLRPRRAAHRQPLFQVMFIWNKPRGDNETPAHVNGECHDPVCAEKAADLRLQRLLMEQRGAPFELTMVVMELGATLRLSFTYDESLFDADFIERMRGHFESILRGVVANPDASVTDLPLLTPREEQSLLAMAAGPVRDFDRGASIAEVLERQANRTPSEVAIESPGASLTYEELHRRANQLARRLSERGVGRGERVGLMMDRSADMVVAVLAIWKAGAAYVPLDPSYPAARIEFLVQDSGARLVVSQSSLVERVPSRTTALLVDEQTDAAALDTPLPPVAGPDDTAYVIYTSGSTGAPKGVLAHHRGACHLFMALEMTYDLHPGERVLFFSSLNFDASVVEMLMTFSHGATLVIGAEQGLLAGEALGETLSEQRINAITVPPSILATVSPEWAARLPDLRILNIAGEACPAELVSLWAPGRRFYNAYGPTEATVWSTTSQCEPDGEAPTIGRPIANTSAYVVDDQLRLTPLGVPGELCVAGPGVTDGYLNRPDLTADRFLPNPFATEDSSPDSSMLYRTGDRARFRPDGQIEFLGRIDGQVKIRGMRIEVGEIESCLRAIPGVDQAVVTARRDRRSQAQLVAYVVPRSKGAVTISDLRAQLAGRLPAALVPSRFMVLDEFPRLISGKIDVSSLPEPEAARPGLDVAFQPPQTPAEQSLAEIWRDVLEIDRVGVNDNFFELGGTSLDLVAIMSKARDAGMEFSIETLLACQTIAELAPLGLAVQPKTTEAHDLRREPAPAVSIVTSAPSGTIAGRMAFESIGVFLPPRSVTTKEIVEACAQPLLFPLEQMTGIRSRPMAGEGTYSIDLARRAIEDCLARSNVKPDQIDALICSNISRCDGPDHRFSFEPSSAARLKHEFGLSSAISFDVSNACAGFFTALSFAESLLKAGAAKRVMVASGEYISHLSQTAQREITGFLDPRVACLTLGDSGVAAIVELSDDPSVGFETLDLFTVGEHADLCVAKVTEGSGGGAIMLTDATKSTQVTVRHAVRHALLTLKSHQWRPDEVDSVIVHQTSSTTIKGVIRELNRAFGQTVCTPANTIDNLAERGNMATNSILVALVDSIRRGTINANSNVVFGVSGSGQVIGTGLYRTGDLPDRLRREVVAADPRPDRALEPAKPVIHRLSRRVRIEGIAAGPIDAGESGDSLRLAAQAALTCLDRSSFDAQDVGLLLHVGVYRNGFLSEPALASMIARDVKLNESASVEDPHRTLGCDLLNGGAGFLHACYLASHVIGAKNLRAAMVTASEVENNRDVRPDHLLGIMETGAAAILEPVAGSQEGFDAFGFFADGEHLDARLTYTEAFENRPSLRVEQDSRWGELCLEAVESAARRFTLELGVALDEIDAVMVSQPTPDFSERLAGRLGLDASKVLATTVEGKDPFTSAIPLGVEKARREGMLSPGTKALFIEVAAGGQVACALYRF